MAPTDEAVEQPQPYNAKKFDSAKKRKRSDSPSRSVSPRRGDDDNNDDLPQPYNAKELHASKKRTLSPSEQQPRKQKRPGARARISEAEREAIHKRQQERERQSAAAKAAAAEEASRLRGINDVVRQHYNNVPERGREWRKTDSKIKGLRSFNNWIKSCIIHKFAPDEDHSPGARERGLSTGAKLLVLDMGCGKGGDLGKWAQAPQAVELYVGLDPAEVSIVQAQGRFHNMGSRGGGGGGGGGRGGAQHFRRAPSSRPFDGRFFVKDCFGEPLESLEIIRQVGFDPSTMHRRGFDVVSVMFAMHYAFETEDKARKMLRNVAGALKKGGRFIGCIPNSDVISERVREFNAKAVARRRKRVDQKTIQKSDSEAGGAGETTETEVLGQAESDGKEEKSAAAMDGSELGEEGEYEEGEAEATAEWGNSIYRVRFPGPTPADGVFRPPFGWKYSFFLDEAVEEVPEYVVPWEMFRALAEDFNLEMQYHKPFLDVWENEKDDAVLGLLSKRMGVRGRDGGATTMTDEEREAAGFYVAFCFYKV